MTDYTPWPAEFADNYRQKGYWRDEPLFQMLTEQASVRPDAVAVICGERQFSYGQLDVASTALALRLLDAGLSAGDHAVVQLPNRAEFYITFFALLKAGIRPVNALYNHRALEMGAYVDQLQPALLIAARAHPLFGDGVFEAQLRAASPGLHLCLYLDDAGDACNLQAWMRPHADTNRKLPQIDASDVAFFQLSGGSTGTPKLIPRTHNDYEYSVRASADICALTPDTRFLCALPAPHNYVLSSPGALGVFMAGGSVVLADSPDPTLCFDVMARHSVTMAALVPSAVGLWVEAARAGMPVPKSLGVVQVGGASFAETLARQVPEILGCKLQQVFGMAEGLVNYTRHGDSAERVFTTQGRPISADDEVQVRDSAGNQCAPGETGQLWVRGPYTIRGYYRSAEHNASAFDGQGFYHSGDLVQRDADGYLRVVGRVKDQINRGGEKIAAEEVEALILRHPDVISAALLAQPDSRLGEKGCAVLVVRKAIRPVELRRHLIGQGVAEYKLPDRFVFIDEMPLTAVGKIDKRRLRSTVFAEN
ncbi:(2,3-dihydroxybenzoyl)adenylate synthase [Falsirhodobacter sp. alg1]|uniref:(2,3-dihydroxybenzoyl)adenylate synthase n=1 Tax=Falsirhodobacter sp. alg1 TaxID=1472418 RepID=UPI000788EAC2|nr:(2,3-dihydroxybenzoyl)adenylate synthase [Falsirhodobacter sp. alg1]